MSTKGLQASPGVPPSLPAVWRGLTTEPGTGVLVVTHEGQIQYANAQAARIFLGKPNGHGAMIGVNVSDLFPQAWVDERRALFDAIQRGGGHQIVRTIWRGYQVFSCIQGIEAATPTKGRRYDRFIIISRRCRQIPSMGRARPSPEQYIESKVASLGPLDSLSEREIEVLALIAQGLSAKEIAAKLHRSVRTIEGHRLMIGRKLKTDDRVQLAEMAFRAGLSPRDADRIRLKPLQTDTQRS